MNGYRQRRNGKFARQFGQSIDTMMRAIAAALTTTTGG